MLEPCRLRGNYTIWSNQPSLHEDGLPVGIRNAEIGLLTHFLLSIWRAFLNSWTELPSYADPERTLVVRLTRGSKRWNCFLSKYSYARRRVSEASASRRGTTPASEPTSEVPQSASNHKTDNGTSILFVDASERRAFFRLSPNKQLWRNVWRFLLNYSFPYMSCSSQPSISSWMLPPRVVSLFSAGRKGLFKRYWFACIFAKRTLRTAEITFLFSVTAAKRRVANPCAHRSFAEASGSDGAKVNLA